MTAIKNKAFSPDARIAELEKQLADKANSTTLQGLSNKIGRATELLETAATDFVTVNELERVEQRATEQLQVSAAKEQQLLTEIQTLTNLRVLAERAAADKLQEVNNNLTLKADAKAVSNALDLTNGVVAGLSKDYTDNKPYKGTSTQTVANQTQVLIPHGIPTTAPVKAIDRTPILTAMTEAAGGFRSVTVDVTNIIVDYDVAVMSGANGWVMKWEL